jgi:NADH-quinone oxidoreductase subunit L
VVAGMTAFYMFRLMGLTFWGTFRGPKAVWDKIHESPAVMTIPLILLAIPSALLGLSLGLPLGASRITEWLAPVFEEGELILRGEGAQPGYELFGIDGVLILASVTIATIGLLIAWRLFGANIGPIRMPARPERVRELTARAPFLYRASLNKWWFDELYHLLFMVIGGRIAAALWWFDREVVDGTVNAVGGATVDAGRGLREIQTGRVQNYALGIAIGLIVMAGAYLILAR